MFRRLLILSLIVVAFVVGGLTAYQHFVSARLQSEFQLWAEQAKAEGWSVSFGAPVRTGWPYAAALEVPNFALSGSGTGALAWHCDRLRVSIDLFRPDHVTIAPIGEQQAGLSGRPLHSFAARTFALNLPFRPAPEAAVATVAVDHLRVPDSGMTADAIGLSVFQLKPETRIRLTFDGLELPPSQPWPLGPRVAHLDAMATVTAPPSAPAPLPALARAWQTDGGELRVSQANLRWGPLDAEIAGTARLDPNLQPTAAGHAVLSGYDQALDVLATRHVMTNDAAFAAKAVLSLMSQTPAAGTPTVDAPFSLRDLVLYIGPIPLARIHPIAWNGT